MYASLARRLYVSPDMNEALGVIKELKVKLRNRIPSIEEVKALFPEIVYTANITNNEILSDTFWLALIRRRRRQLPSITNR